MPAGLIEFDAPPQRLRGWLATPVAPRPAPALVLLSEWWGLVPHIQELAERLAAAGFRTLAPDLYLGRTAEAPDEAGKLMMALDIAATAKRVRAAAEHLLADPGTRGPRAAVMGFCMGGQLALDAACRYPERFAAVVDFYGVHPAVTPALAGLDGPVLGWFGEEDGSVPPAAARALEQALKAAGKPAEIRILPGAGHAFFNDTRPQVYRPEAADLAWRRTIEFLHEQLG